MGCSSSKELHQTGAVPPAPVEPKEATVNKAATVNEHVPPVLEQKTSVVLPPKEPLPPYLLHIAVSPMGEESHSRSVAADFLSAFQEKHKGMIVVTRDLAAEPVDHIEDDTINVEFVEERARTPRMRDLRDKRMDLIQEIMEADAILVSTPMYNWCVPSTLKAYIDHLVLPGVLDPVVKGLADRPVTCIIAYGGTYAPGSFNPHFDYATGYLQMVFKNLGVTDFKVVRVEYTLAGVMSGMEPLLPKKTDSIETARKQAQQIAMNLFGDKNEVSESASSTGESAIEELISSPAPVLTVDTLPEKLPTSEEPTVSEEVAPSNEAIALESDSTTIEAPKIADVTPYEHLPPHQELEREETAKVPEVEKEVIAETATPSSIMEDIPAPEVVAPSMRTGYMMKRGHLVKNWKNRYFVLDNGSLTYYEGPQKLPPYGSGKKGSLEIKGATVASSGSQVTIVAGSNDLILEIKDTRDRVDWITALKKHATYYSK